MSKLYSHCANILKKELLKSKQQGQELLVVQPKIEKAQLLVSSIFEFFDRMKEDASIFSKELSDLCAEKKVINTAAKQVKDIDRFIGGAYFNPFASRNFYEFSKELMKSPATL